MLVGSVGAITASQLVGCGAGSGGNDATRSAPPNLIARPMGDGVDPEIYRPDGILVHSDRVSDLSGLYLPKDGGKVLIVDFMDEGAKPPQQTADGRWGFNVGCYRIMGRWEGGHVGGCIGRNTWRHINFHVRNWCSNRDMCNLGVIAKYRVCVTLNPRSTYSTKLN
jgi:hypothetical protein